MPTQPSPNPYGGPPPGPPGPSPYGGPPPGPYGGPPPPPPRSGGRGTGRIIATVVIALIIVGGGAVGAIVLIGGDEDEGGGAAPAEASAQATIEAFAQAWQAKDCAAYDTLLSDRLRESEDPCSADQFDGEPEPGGPEIVEESDDSATAELNVSEGGFEASYEITLVNEGGVWLVDDVELEAAMSGPST